HRPVPHPPPAAWTLVLLALFLPGLSALAAWPLHRLALHLGLPASPALLAAALWILVPARSLFTPSLDQALPFLLLTAAALAAGALLPWLVLAACTGYNPLAAFKDAMVQHRLIAVESRSYATWLRWNPYDFALLLGPAVAGLAAAALVPRGARTPVFRALTW